MSARKRRGEFENEKPAPGAGAESHGDEGERRVNRYGEW